MISSLNSVMACLTSQMKKAVDKAMKNEKEGYCEEIHISVGKRMFVKTTGGVTVSDVICDSEGFKRVLACLCKNSLYAHKDTINRGYISYDGGVRVGVCGVGVSEGGRLISVSEVRSLNIRLPNPVKGISEPVISVLEHYGFSGGLLIYSLPGVGKTTLLRDMALALSSPPYSKRVSLIDTRGELYTDSDYKDGTLLDVFTGYPPSHAIECAIRTMSPEIVIIDEIGGAEECQALRTAIGKGVSVIASAHSGGVSELMKNKDIKSLAESGIFRCYVGIKRRSGKMSFAFTEADKLL